MTTPRPEHATLSSVIPLDVVHVKFPAIDEHLDLDLLGVARPFLSLITPGWIPVHLSFNSNFPLATLVAILIHVVSFTHFRALELI